MSRVETCVACVLDRVHRALEHERSIHRAPSPAPRRPALTHALQDAVKLAQLMLDRGIISRTDVSASA